ncbi:MAG TPA: SulP family inorganic anion transporter [Kofleriaceae bacterium]
MKPAVARESALARSRLDNLNTNRRAPARSDRAPGVGEIRQTLRARWGDIASLGWSPHDLLAGLTVATVAIPLNVALAIAAGLPPSTGLIAGAAGGVVAATFGGSSYQVSGPAAALNVMVFALVARFGAGGAAAAALVSGVVGLAAGVLGYGKLANLLPKLVLAGFTTGVGLKLLDQQVPILLGLGKGGLATVVADFWSMAWLRQVQWLSVVCGLIVAWITLGLAQLKSFPSSLLGILIATFVAYELGWQIPRVGEVDLSGVALALPHLADGASWLELVAMALPLALLSCAESLISAKAVDEMSGHKSGYAANAELFGQGLGNVVSGLLGGMPVSGVIVRSSVGLSSGARTRLTAIYHGVLLAVAAYCFGDTLALIPVSALAGLLVVIAWRLIKLRPVLEAARRHRLHAIAFLASAIGTCLGHLISGLAIGCAVMYLDQYLGRRHARRATAVIRPSPTIRAVVTHTGAPVPADHDPGVPVRDQAVWHRQVRTRPRIHPSAFVHPTASIIGWVELGREVNVAADTSIRADEGAPFYIGDRSNVQDGVVIHALKEKWVMVEGRQWAVYIGSDVSLAHQALVHGPCLIGANSFIGFKAIVHDAIVGEGCFIGLGAVVAGVELPPRKRVPNGWVVDNPAKVAELPDVEDAHAHFNADVVQVNRGLVVAYARHVDRDGEHPPAHTLPRPLQLSSLKPL